MSEYRKRSDDIQLDSHIADVLYQAPISGLSKPMTRINLAYSAIHAPSYLQTPHQARMVTWHAYDSPFSLPISLCVTHELRGMISWIIMKDSAESICGNLMLECGDVPKRPP